MIFDIWVFGLGNLHYGNNVSFMANMIILLLDHATSPGHHSLVPPARNAVASEFRNWGVDREGSELNYPRFLRPLAKTWQNGSRCQARKCSGKTGVERGAKN